MGTAVNIHCCKCNIGFYGGIAYYSNSSGTYCRSCWNEYQLKLSREVAQSNGQACS